MEENKKGLNKVLMNPIANTILEKTALSVANSILSLLKPPPSISITDFCEQNLKLPKEVTSEDGLYRCTKTPYLRKVMDCMHPNHPCNKVVFYSGTQLGKTQALLNTLFFYMANSPCGMVFGFSNDGEKKKMVQSRMDPMIKHNKWLSDLIVKSNNGKSGDTLNLKMFKGGYLTIASAQSPSQFRSMPARIVALDEIDAYPEDAKGEGDIISLAEKRTSTYGGRYKMYLSSTTTNKTSKIKAEYENTDMQKYFVPCPKCGQMQLISWDRITIKAEGTKVEEVYMNCEACGYHIHDYDKATMLPNGEWRATNKTPTATNAIGFWLSGLYAPIGWQSWEKCATEYLEAINTNSSAKLSSFYNCILAEPYEVETETPKWERIYNLSRASDYNRGEIPEEVIFLTSGSDVQKDRIETEVKGWTRLGRGISIETYKFYCEDGMSTKDITSKAYTEYENTILNGIWTRRDGYILRTSANAIDRSYNTPTVNAFWARCNQPTRFIMVRGNDRLKDRISAMKEYKPANASKDIGKRSYAKTNDRIDFGVYRYIEVGTSVIKAETYKMLSTDDSVDRDTRGYQVFPCDYDEEYFKQLTAEIREINPSTKKEVWKKIRDRNEALDMHVYNVAMWYFLGAHSLTDNDYDKLEADMKVSTFVANAQPSRATRARRRIVSSGGIY